MASSEWEDYAVENNLDISEFDLQRDTAVIRKVGEEWCVMSESGKKLGCYKSRKKAEKRLKQIEYFKHQKGYTEEAKQQCYCRACGTYYWTRGNQMCYNSRCPNCGETDDIVEMTGEI